MASSSQILSLIGAIALVMVSSMTIKRAAAAVANNKQQQVASDDLVLFPQAITCRQDEKPFPGRLPECEPTCRNPTPICVRIFQSSLDFVPCFCKAPLVRHSDGSSCVPVSQCPQ